MYITPLFELLKKIDKFILKQSLSVSFFNTDILLSNKKVNMPKLGIEPRTFRSSV